MRAMDAVERLVCESEVSVAVLGRAGTSCSSAWTGTGS